MNEKKDIKIPNWLWIISLIIPIIAAVIRSTVYPESLYALTLINVLWTSFTLVAFRGAKNIKQLLPVCVITLVVYFFLVRGLLGNSLEVLFMPFFLVLLIPFLLDRLAFRKNPGNGLETLIFPFVYVAIILLIEEFCFGTAYHFEYVFSQNTLLVQGASLIGGRGIYFMFLWLIDLVVTLILTGKPEKRMKIILAIFSVLIGAMLIYDGVIVSRIPEESDTIKIAYTTGPYIGVFIDDEESNYDVITCEEAMASLEKSAKQAKAEGAVLLTYNEEAFSLPYEDVTPFLEFAKETAVALQLNLLIGLEPYDDEEVELSENALYMITTEGEITAFHKNHLIPVLESSYYTEGSDQIGSATIQVDDREIKLAFAICYDGEFADFVAEMDKDTDVLILPSWDWDAVDAHHASNVILRSVENGVAMLKPTYDGTTVATDAYGRIIAKTHTDDTGFETVCTVDLPLNSHRTIYDRIHLFINVLIVFGAFGFTSEFIIADKFRNRNDDDLTPYLEQQKHMRQL